MGMFSVFGGKEKKKSTDSGTYYRRLGTAFTILKLLCILLTIIVVLMGFSFHTDQINMDNFRYLMNSLGTETTESLVYKSIYYDSSEENKFALVRGDLAVVNSSGSAVYSLAGQRKSADASLRMDNPEVLSGAKYMYIYDLGGTEFIIKDTLDTVETKRYSYPIRAAAATASGYFTVVSAEKATRSTVFVYDDKYREVYKCSFGSLYTLTVDLNDNADRLLCGSFTAEDGQFITEVALYSLSEKEPVFTYTCLDEYPYKVQFTHDGGFMLLTDKGCRFFDNSLKCVAFNEISEDALESYYLDESHFIEVFSTSEMTAEEKIKVYGKDGGMLWEGVFALGVRLAECDGNYLFVISGSELLAVDLESVEKRHAEVESDVLDLLPVEDGNILVLAEGSGYVLDYGALFEKRTEESE